MHETIRTTLSTGTAEIDVRMVDLVVALDALGLRTDSCCQQDHVLVGDEAVVSEHAYIAFANEASLKRFVSEAAAVLPPNRVFSEFCTLIGRGNGYEHDWDWERWYRLPFIGKSWAYGMTPWRDPSTAFVGVTLMVAFPQTDLPDLLSHFSALKR